MSNLNFSLFLGLTSFFLGALVFNLETVRFFLRFIQQILDDPALTNV